MELIDNNNYNIIHIKGDDTDVIKYEFNVTFNNIVYLKMNIFKYLDRTYNSRVGYDFIYDNTTKNFIENVIIDVDNIKFEKIDTSSDTKYDEKEMQLVLDIINDIDMDNKLVLPCLDINCVFRNFQNEENRTFEYFYFNIEPGSIYFHNYIDFILKRSFNNILQNSSKKTPDIIPNFLAGTKCDNRYRIVIADLYSKDEKWKKKMDNYLKRDRQLIDKREGKRLLLPPENHIEDQTYFHFLAINENEDIIGFCICSIIPISFLRTEKGIMKFLEIFYTPFFKNGVKTDNPN